jgi:sulfate permease, SulP family
LFLKRCRAEISKNVEILLLRERQRGVSVWLVGLNPEVLSVIKRSPLGDVLGRERMHFNLELAVAKYLAAPLSESAA